MSIVYTFNTYFVMHWSMLFIQKCLVNVLMQYQVSAVISLQINMNVENQAHYKPWMIV